MTHRMPLVEHEGIVISHSAPPQYLEWLSAAGAFFESDAWGSVLQQGFGAKRFYLWDTRYELGQALTCFRKGPIWIGYLGFPVCATPRALSRPYDLERMVLAIRKLRIPLSLLRISVSAYGGCKLAFTPRIEGPIETCITNLADWRADADATRRRDLRFAQRRSAPLKHCDNLDSAALYKLYAETVARHRGNLRYTASYFAALTSMPRYLPVRFSALCDEVGLASVTITIRSGDTTYYLHSCTRSDALRLGATDLLLCQAIEHARAEGAAKFNLLSSPATQPGLIRFKEKWGGVSRPCAIIDIPLGPIGWMLLRVLP